MKKSLKQRVVSIVLIIFMIEIIFVRIISNFQIIMIFNDNLEFNCTK